MEIKAGQWVRTKSGCIGYVFALSDGVVGDFDIEVVFEGEIKQALTYEENIIKVANTPQELVECGDLVETKYKPFPRYVFDVSKNFVEFGKLDFITKEYITKILTPNSNGGYDLQWEEK